MNKFVIKKKLSHNNNTTTTTTNETTSATVQNLKENVTYTKEQNKLYNRIYSIVGNSGSIVLSDYVGKVEQLLYLLYDLEGKDKFLDFIFHDPTQTYLTYSILSYRLTTKCLRNSLQLIHHYFFDNFFRSILPQIQCHHFVYLHLF